MFKIKDFRGFSAEDAARIIGTGRDGGRIQLFANRSEVTKANSIISSMKYMYGENKFMFSIVVYQ